MILPIGALMIAMLQKNGTRLKRLRNEGKISYFEFKRGKKMKKLLAILFLIVAFAGYSENMPSLYFPFGTSRNDVLFDMGDPYQNFSKKYIAYKSYQFRSYEVITFLFSDDQKLIAITVDISPDIEESGSFESVNTFYQEVQKHYYEYYSSFFGDPLINNSNGVVWKFDDGFVVFWKARNKAGIFNYELAICPKESAVGSQFESLYPDLLSKKK
jgi:hypothetical protein